MSEKVKAKSYTLRTESGQWLCLLSMKIMKETFKQHL
jgi:hypothetical protein